MLDSRLSEHVAEDGMFLCWIVYCNFCAFHLLCYGECYERSVNVISSAERAHNRSVTWISQLSFYLFTVIGMCQ